ncbi:MAG: cardiolipin synthase [Thermodesulfobacteriota bacterium]
MDVFNWITLFLVITLQVIAAGHALLYKRDPRASWAWIVTCILFPPFGAILYFLLGINRVRTKAQKLKSYWPEYEFGIKDSKEITTVFDFRISAEDFHYFATLSDATTKRPLLTNNHIEILHNGNRAYPKMLQAIREAREYVYLSTYIFDTGNTGRNFIAELDRAQKRGVDVRVLVDGIGEWYSYPRVSKLLKQRHIPCSRFLPPKLFPPSPYINLRNHRKLMIVDGVQAFTGGMNIRDQHVVNEEESTTKGVQDIHFSLTGPVVNQLELIFLEDWGFSTGNYDQSPREPAQASGTAICKSITVGPDEDLNKLSKILEGTISLSKYKVSIMTPYFLPTKELVGALQSAALKGVEVNIVLPAKNNLFYVHWATRNMLWEMLQYGVRVFYQPPPFAHTKLFLVDGFYAQIGSANLDPRSLRLNFEGVVEVYDQEFVETLTEHIDTTIQKSREVTLQEVDSRPLPIRIRDSVFWLFSPYF